MRRKSHVKDPRANQRERTRSAIMEATRTLLLAGRLPSIAEVAEAARVSRATAYRYFPTQGALIQEAIAAVLIPPDQWEPLLAGARGLSGRIERLVGKVFDMVQEHEALVRGALLLSLEQWAKAQSGEPLEEPPIQRGGRIEPIGAALAPFASSLGPETSRRLTIALSLLLGIETRIVLRDIWNLDEEEARSVTLWIARTLARASQNEAQRRPNPST